jgi:hypothetical protein
MPSRREGEIGCSTPELSPHPTKGQFFLRARTVARGAPHASARQSAARFERVYFDPGRPASRPRRSHPAWCSRSALISKHQLDGNIVRGALNDRSGLPVRASLRPRQGVRASGRSNSCGRGSNRFWPSPTSNRISSSASAGHCEEPREELDYSITQRWAVIEIVPSPRRARSLLPCLWVDRPPCRQAMPQSLSAS